MHTLYSFITIPLIAISLVSCSGGSSPAGSTDCASHSETCTQNPDDKTTECDLAITNCEPEPFIVWGVCETDNASWGFENDKGCISYSFNPKTRSAQKPLIPKLSDINANKETHAAFQYLLSIYGEKVLSGQKDSTPNNNIDMYTRVINDTGKAPALIGYDFNYYLDQSDSPNGKQQVQEAIIHSQRGGFVAFSWHWRDPTKRPQTFYTKNTNFYIPILNGELDENSPAFQSIQNDLAAIAGQLQLLQDNGVVVLWRPLHEGADTHFWWGRQRQDQVSAAHAYILLWRHIYAELTQKYDIHNLIWVWNAENALYYPGDAYVDIASADIYGNPQDYSSQKRIFINTKNYPTTEKMVALSENSNIPSPTKIMTDNAYWLFFMTWHDQGEADHISDEKNFWTGEYYNSDVHKRRVYNDPSIITLDLLEPAN
jgi:mannan endo-1,4-beta-mannosidase